MSLNRLDEIFTEKKIQNRVLAKHFEKSEGTISKWRNNKRQPSIDELNEIAKLLRVNIKELLNDSNWTDETSETYEELKAKYK